MFVCVCLAMSYLHTVLAVLATSSFGYLCMVWSLWLNVGRGFVAHLIDTLWKRCWPASACLIDSHVDIAMCHLHAMFS